VLRDAEEEVVGQLAAVVEHRDAAGRVERAHATACHELDVTLGKGCNQRAGRIR